MKKVVFFTFILHQLLFTALCLCQSTDSSVLTSPVTDPLKNRLFLMPTGQILDEGKVLITDIDLVLIHVGYSPLSFLQINTSALLPFPYGKEERELNLAFGTKIQIFEPSGLLKGVAIGIDVGYFGKPRTREYMDYEPSPLSTAYYKGAFEEIFQLNTIRTSPFVTSVNISSSFGVSAFQVHFNLGQLFLEHYKDESIKDFASFPSYIQFGLVYDFGVTFKKQQTKLILDCSLINFQHEEHTGSGYVIAGFRFYSKKISVDLALSYQGKSPNFFSGNALYPYLGFNFIL